MKTSKIKLHLFNSNFVKEMLRFVFSNKFDVELIDSINISNFIKQLY